MISAIVLVNTEVGEESKVLERIKKIEGVEEAHTLWGVYDLMVKIKANSIDKLKETIKSHLRRMDNVNALLTLMIVEATHK
ncbi:MAG: Lrp/AsnC ligand binding domain-containing protein [Candidatus Bathyarchaeia archaeon]|jgi:DNA-binding Lrp family transcriptional regulator